MRGDEFWLSEAAQPIHDLIETLDLSPDLRIFEAGCGTGHATALLARRCSQVLAVDISHDMLSGARQRLAAHGAPGRVRFREGDAIVVLGEEGPFDLVFSSWVLGYIPLAQFLAAADLSLARDGRVAFVVHLDNSPREPMEIFARLVAIEPSALLKRVAFDFPRDLLHVEQLIAAAKLTVERLWEGAVVFRYPNPEAVFKHLLKSGAGTAFYDAIDPLKRDRLVAEFLRILAERHPLEAEFPVVHEYVACIARRK